MKERVRQHQRRIAEERKHTTVENVGDAEIWPLQLDFNPPAGIDENSESNIAIDEAYSGASEHGEADVDAVSI